MEVYTCPNCKEQIVYEPGDAILGGFPHFECPVCGGMIPLF